MACAVCRIKDKVQSMIYKTHFLPKCIFLPLEELTIKFFQFPHHTIFPSYLSKCYSVVAPKVQGKSLSLPRYNIGAPQITSRKQFNSHLFIIHCPIPTALPFQLDRTPSYTVWRNSGPRCHPSGLHCNCNMTPLTLIYCPFTVYLLIFQVTSERSSSLSLQEQIMNPQSNLQFPITALFLHYNYLFTCLCPSAV